MLPSKYDFVIVGGGTSGLVVATRLSQDPNISVLVLEAGEDHSPGPWVTTPALWSSLLGTDFDWRYLSEAQAALNAACAHLGLDYIDEKSLAKFTGPIQASFAEEVNDPLPKAWVETFKSLGYAVSGDPFTGGAVGGYVNVMNIHPATKQYSHARNAYYEPVRTRDNLHIVASASVNEIFLERQKTEVIANGIYTSRMMKRTVMASKEVILAAGVFNTPKLLELSSIGSASLLDSLKILVVIDNDNVGENLQDRPNGGVSFEVRDGFETVDDLARQDMAAIGAAMEAYSKDQSGPFATGGNFAGGFLPVLDFLSPDGKEDLEKILQSQVRDSKQFSKDHAAFVESLLHTGSEGSGGFFSYPALGNFVPETGTKMAIDPKYLSNPLDLEVLARHVRFIGKIASLEPLWSPLKLDGRMSHDAPANLDDLDEVKEYVKKVALSCWNPTSTCAMLPLEKDGVVDTNLIVCGTKNLRIVDASVIPLSTRGNCQTSVYAVAERAAD
ncbi:hypothetical protein G7Y89_g12538 [Cudoniella acicularis]|uniref:Glucose-methanol-choline oxidoreductase N-terminal domain-containing protein n=1 Tax=Cudoniella acicularis TaxID=354080 RepID=A0A8H4R8Z1_9HELO|nr:hypothetical protein G7Y89_g12538 [Cudoniella acicularis]